jgi:hypothetical protein
MRWWKRTLSNKTFLRKLAFTNRCLIGQATNLLHTRLFDTGVETLLKTFLEFGECPSQGTFFYILIFNIAELCGLEGPMTRFSYLFRGSLHPFFFQWLSLYRSSGSFRVFLIAIHI